MGGILKEAKFVERLSHLEDENRKLVEELDNQRAIVERVNAELGQTKTELEQEKNRCANTREKLTIAVQKGKGLVQQRDSLKQSIAEKLSELEKYRIELKEKSSALEAAELSKEELIRSENSVASLQETLSQNNVILQKLGEMLSQTSVPEELQSMDIVERLRWLVDESVKTQGKICGDYYKRVEEQKVLPNCQIKQPTAVYVDQIYISSNTTEK